MSCTLPPFLENGWQYIGDPRKVISYREVSAAVSTNRVYELTLEDGQQRIAKTSSYGNYPQFCQDHQLISEWIRRLGGTRFREFLAPIVERNGRPLCYREDNEWLVLYEKVPFYDFLPGRLGGNEIDSLGSELAHFHQASLAAATTLTPCWKSVGADVGSLHSLAGNVAWRATRGLDRQAEYVIRQHCEMFLRNAEDLGYHRFPRIPLLLDWNTGNFSVGFQKTGFRLYTRWDYDWFRVEPRTLDFYFCARVVRDAGDEDNFSYLAAPLFEPRFAQFLAAYHAENSLSEPEILFLKEAYRFFILTYVLHHGEHFFRAELRRRLQKEALQTYLPHLVNMDFRSIADTLLS